MKIAVTGASGFIGRNVVAALARDGEVALVASSRSAGGALPPGVRHVALDMAAPEGAYDRLGRPDVVVHLAWNGLPNYRSLHHFETELPAQYRFLRGLIDDGLTRLVVAGTCYEYGMQSGALDETMVGLPTNPYALAKVTLHKQLEFLKDQVPFALTWARLFYAYGEGQAPSSIYSLLRAAVARGDARFPMSAGEQLRDFLPIETIAAHLAMLARQGGDVGIVNICSGQPTSIRGLVERWLADNGWSIALDLGHYPYPDYEPLAFWGSAAKLRALTTPADHG
jgi:dTDP-6-deoxy-L-talose 4-dehydrogenase (NAD+)